MGHSTINQIEAARNIAINRRKGFFLRHYEQRQLLLMSVPFVIIIMIFSFLPLWGWIMAFQDYKVIKGIWGSDFVGFENFRIMFEDEQFFRVLRNTFVMGFLNMITGFIGAIVLALLLNEIRMRFFKRTIQTLTYIPHFVSWVVITNIVLTLTSADSGIINAILLKFGWIDEPIYFMLKDTWFWFIHTAADFWKELGWSTIIYLAVLVGINPEHYEAAEMDGASRFRKIWHISIPGLIPVATLLLIMKVGYIIQSGYESQYLLGNEVVREYSEVLDLYALRYASMVGDWSYGVTVSIFKSVVSIIMVVCVNYFAYKMTRQRLF